MKPEPGRAQAPRLPHAALEVDLDVEPFPLGVKVGGGNEPRAIDAKSELKEMNVAHAGTRIVIDPASHSAAVSCAPQGRPKGLSLTAARIVGRSSANRVKPQSDRSTQSMQRGGVYKRNVPQRYHKR